LGALDGKIAIVTGAGRGIGRGEALLLAHEGARVVVNDLGAEAREVADEIVAAGGEAVANNDDVASWEGAERLVNLAIDTWGRLDVLVNNAGILRDAMSFNMTEAEWDSVINVHLKGHFAPCHFAAKHWRDRAKGGDDNVTGRIVNTASESGLFGNAGQSNYSAAKAGIASMTIVLARELSKYGVTANCIAPRARTRLTATVAGAGDYMSGPEWDPENIAPTVAFLASDAAADVSGQIFVVWGPRVHVMSGWSPVTTLDRGEGRWTVDELVARKAELFAKSASDIPPMGFGL
jgi:NAD(P)-dependent dehydrogenase (short-subunit alcohol dehydrogenase family)